MNKCVCVVCYHSASVSERASVCVCVRCVWAFTCVRVFRLCVSLCVFLDIIDVGVRILTVACLSV